MYFHYFQLAEVKFTELLYKSNVTHEAPHHTGDDIELNSTPSRVILLDYIICICYYYYIIYFSFNSINLMSLSLSDINTQTQKLTVHIRPPFCKRITLRYYTLAGCSIYKLLLSFFFVYWRKAFHSGRLWSARLRSLAHWGREGDGEVGWDGDEGGRGVLCVKKEKGDTDKTDEILPSLHNPRLFSGRGDLGSITGVLSLFECLHLTSCLFSVSLFMKKYLSCASPALQ